jgi:hypothetical protein
MTTTERLYSTQMDAPFWEKGMTAVMTLEKGI